MKSGAQDGAFDTRTSFLARKLKKFFFGDFFFFFFNKYGLAIWRFCRFGDYVYLVLTDKLKSENFSETRIDLSTTLPSFFINLKAKVHHQLDFVSVKILKEDASFQDYKLSTNLKVNSKLT